MDSKIKILVLDDDSRFLDGVKTILEEENYYAKVEQNEQAAIGRLLIEPFHIVIINCILKKGQGIAIAKKIKKLLGDSVSIVLMSDVFSEASVANYIGKDVEGFLKKPIDRNHLNQMVKKIQNKSFYQSDDNFLLKFFSKDTSIDNKLKELIFKKTMNGAEFSVLLSLLLSFKSKSAIRFSIDDKKYTLFTEDGKVVNCNSHDEVKFLYNKLHTLGLLSQEEFKKLQNPNPEVFINSLIEQGCTSPYNISQIKYSLLEKILKNTLSSNKISFEVDLFCKSKIEKYFTIDKQNLSEFIINANDDSFNQLVKKLFNPDVQKCSIILNSEDVQHDNLEISSLINQIKKGDPIHKLALSQEPRVFSYLLSLLCEWDLALKHDIKSGAYKSLEARYKALEAVLETEDTDEVFSLLSGTTEGAANHNNVKKIYREFMNFNHIDKQDQYLPKHIVKSINATLSKMKHHHDLIVDINFRSRVEKERKERQIQEDMEISYKQKTCVSTLENEQFKKALEIFNAIPDDVVKNDIEWQLLYLWIAFSSPKLISNPQKKQKFFQNIKKNHDDLLKNPIYQYVMGLYMESVKDTERALKQFHLVKSIDPSFHAVYSALKRCQMAEHQKSKNENVFSKLMKTSFKKSS